jgi:hypothetical protein
MVSRASDQRRKPASWRIALLVFLILTLSNVAVLGIGWIYSGDVRAWWPVALVVFSAISFGYAAMFSAATHAASGLGLRFSIIYNVVLALTLLLHGALFYTVKVDWLSVNSGVIQLSFFQRIIHSDATVYSIYAVFLAGALIIAEVMKRRHSR